VTFFRTRAVGAPAFAWASSRRLGDCDTGAINQQAVDGRQGERNMQAQVIKGNRLSTTILTPEGDILAYGPIRVYFSVVTPAIAARLLSQMNTQNREMNRGQIERIMRAMREGRWRTTHQGIAFDSQRAILDAQHRLTALVETDTTHTFIVSEGWAPEIRPAIDGVWARQLRDNLRMFGIAEDARLTSSVLNHIQRSVNGSAEKIEFEDAKALVQRYEGGLRFICSRTTASGRGTAASHLAAAFVYAYPKSSKASDAAWTDLQTGALLATDDPIFRLREEVIGRIPGQKLSNHRMTDADRVAFFRKTLNALYHRVHDLKTKQIKVSEKADDFFRSSYSGK
jgi:hypothetical protein